MKLYAWNIGMAATIPSNNGYDLNAWVIDEISEEKPDCFVLTEFVVSRGMDVFIRKIEENNYHWFISVSTNKNGIFIAIKRSVFEFDNTLDYLKDTVRTAEVLSGTCLPDFLEVRVRWEGKILSIIGIRINLALCEDFRAKITYDQFRALDQYLASLKHPVICIGDYNAYWGTGWHDARNVTLPNTAAKNYEVYTPKYGVGEWWSFVFDSGSKAQLDHMVTNVTGKKIDACYDWGFLGREAYKTVKSSEDPIKIGGIPDHAILKVTIE